mmetsp:Transcript_40/g.106  ORF Transcript_40/g.106 Transcript_40/m.106 type:complete len:440 (-) Transcript_40:275-1594(-)
MLPGPTYCKAAEQAVPSHVRRKIGKPGSAANLVTLRRADRVPTLDVEVARAAVRHGLVVVRLEDLYPRDVEVCPVVQVLARAIRVVPVIYELRATIPLRVVLHQRVHRAALARVGRPLDVDARARGVPDFAGPIPAHVDVQHDVLRRHHVRGVWAGPRALRLGQGERVVRHEPLVPVLRLRVVAFRILERFVRRNVEHLEEGGRPLHGDDAALAGPDLARQQRERVGRASQLVRVRRVAVVAHAVRVGHRLARVRHLLVQFATILLAGMKRGLLRTIVGILQHIELAPIRPRHPDGVRPQGRPDAAAPRHMRVLHHHEEVLPAVFALDLGALPLGPRRRAGPRPRAQDCVVGGGGRHPGPQGLVTREVQRRAIVGVAREEVKLIEEVPALRRPLQAVVEHRAFAPRNRRRQRQRGAGRRRGRCGGRGGGRGALGRRGRV